MNLGSAINVRIRRLIPSVTKMICASSRSMRAQDGAPALCKVHYNTLAWLMSFVFCLTPRVSAAICSLRRHKISLAGLSVKFISTSFGHDKMTSSFMTKYKGLAAVNHLVVVTFPPPPPAAYQQLKNTFHVNVHVIHIFLHMISATRVYMISHNFCAGTQAMVRRMQNNLYFEYAFMLLS